MEIEYEHIFESALGQGINLFVGSGFSTLARDSEDRPMPTGTELQAELIGEFGLSHTSGLTLPQIATILEVSRKDRFYSFLKNRFTVAEFDSRYSCLDSVNIKTIFTTNIDDLIFKICTGPIKLDTKMGFVSSESEG
jgi:hypothetical protein